MSDERGDRPPPLPAGVNPDDVDADALWQKWIDEEENPAAVGGDTHA